MNMDVKDILRRRVAPAIFVVDDACRVVLGWQAPDGEAATASASSPHLPAGVEQAVGELQAALRAGANAPLVRLLDSGYVVRIAPLAGELGTYCAVLIERFRARDPRNRKAETTRADMLGRIIGQTTEGT